MTEGGAHQCATYPFTVQSQAIGDVEQLCLLCQIWLCGVEDLFQSQDWVHRNTNPLLGKTSPFKIFHVCTKLF